MAIRYSEEALLQLRELRRYIARESGYPDRARGYVDRIRVYCKKLEMYPNRGTLRDDLRPGLRLIGFEKRVTIAFTVEQDQPIILGVFYGGQDVEAHYVDQLP